MIPEGMQVLKVTNHPAPFWKTPQYLVDVAEEGVRAFVIDDYVGDGDHALCQQVSRSIVTEILDGTDQYDRELTTLVLAAEQYRKEQP